MEKVLKFLGSCWFKASLAAILGIALLIKKENFFAGMAFGFAVREILTYKKSGSI